MVHQKLPVPDVLFDGEHLQVVHFPGTSDWTLLTFDIMHARASGRTAFAATLAVKNSINLIGIVPKYPCWYPAEEIKRLRHVVRRNSRGKVLAYGASMGGYGALKYGRTLRADAALAFSPQGSISPHIIGRKDPRYLSHYREDLHRKMEITRCNVLRRSFVVIDPAMRLDMFQLGLIKDKGRLNKIQLPFTGHQCVRAMASSEIATRVFEATLAGDRNEIARALRSNRRNTAIFYTEFARTLTARGRHNAAVLIASRGIERFGRDQELVVSHASALFAAGRVDEGLAEAATLANHRPNVAKYQVFYAGLLDQAGQSNAAVNHLVAAQHQCDHHLIPIRLSDVLVRAGRIPEASDVLFDASETWPEHRQLFKRLHRNRIGVGMRVDQAAE